MFLMGEIRDKKNHVKMSRCFTKQFGGGDERECILEVVRSHRLEVKSNRSLGDERGLVVSGQ